MSKTIIITTEEMAKIVKENFLYKCDVITDVYCGYCQKTNSCSLACLDDDSCPHTDDECVAVFVNVVFANYMIPFS